MSKLTGFEDLSNEELITAYTTTLKSAGTKRVYKIELNKLNSFVNKPFKDVSKLDIINYNQTITTPSDATRQRIYGTIRAFFKWLVWAGVIWENENPVQGTFKKLTPNVDIASKCMLVSEIEAVKQAAYPNARDYAMIAVMATTGVRISELVNMKWADMFQVYDKEVNGLVWYIKIIGKGNKLREVFIKKGTELALIRLNGGNPIDPTKEGYIFTRIRDKKVDKLTVNGARWIIDGIAEKAKVKLTPHWFRHTFLSQAANNGAPIREVQNVAGHSSIRTTEGYLWAQGTKVANYFPVEF